mmetsp:Transcript_91873/g.182518  ORF Transcript_91873/g.182518 Transcript_91873/m.182518 type:complete len:132 (+) Transcript_91873:1435-1830(+)
MKDESAVQLMQKTLTVATTGPTTPMARAMNSITIQKIASIKARTIGYTGTPTEMIRIELKVFRAGPAEAMDQTATRAIVSRKGKLNKAAPTEIAKPVEVKFGPQESTLSTRPKTSQKIWTSRSHMMDTDSS